MDNKDVSAILARMVSQYEGPLLRTCCIYLRDAALAEDAVQETWLKVCKALPDFRGESSEKTWLMRIAINVCRDMQRTAWFRHVDRRIEPAAMERWCEPEDEDAQDLAQAIQQLPVRLRETVLLYYYQDMTMQEVGRALGIAVSTVDKRLRQAHARLEDLLREEILYERA